MFMRYFPINLDVRGKPVVIVGGGAVAARKCQALLAAGARVTVIAPTLAGLLRELAENGRVTHLARKYSEGDLAGACLVFAATDTSKVNRAVANEAKINGIPADITDAPELGDFTSPAVINRGDLLITVSTGGESPALARKVRMELEKRYGPEYADLIKILGKVREKLLTEKANSPYNKKISNQLVDQDLPGLIKKSSTTEIDHLLLKLCGPGFSLAELGIGEKDKE
jgi:precorrin-2 dehydrogenase/sirohydrochlorin ferrochelatase